MANNSGGSDIKLIFGVAGGGSLSGESGKEIYRDLNLIAGEINKNPLKIKFQADQASLDTFKKQVQKCTNALGSVVKIKVNIPDLSEAITKGLEKSAANLAASVNGVAASAQEAAQNLGAAGDAAERVGRASKSADAELEISIKHEKERFNLLTKSDNLIRRMSSVKPTTNIVENRNLENAIANLRTLGQQLENNEISAEKFALELAKIGREFAGFKKRTLGSQNAPTLIAPNTDNFTAAYNRINSLIATATKYQNEYTAAAKGTTSGDYAKFGTVIEQLEELSLELESGNLSQEKYIAKTKLLSSTISKSAKSIQAAEKAHKSFGDRLGDVIRRFSAWFSGSQIFLKAIETVKRMATEVIELDTAMTELKKVTDETDVTYAKFLDNAYTRAKKVGATLTDTVNATANFARLGLSIEEAENVADAALIYKNIGDGIKDINEASDSIIATMQAFGIEAADAMSIVDKFNLVGNNFAITSQGIGEALLRSSAAMRAANNTIDETIALATAANTIVQNPESVGTSLKTISMYLRAAKTEAEGAGEATDGMAASVSELRQEILDITSRAGQAVDIQIDENTYKSTFQILQDLSRVWGDITNEMDKSNLLEMLGGKRNANIVAAILQNFSVAEEALATSLNSSGSALQENEKVLDSIKGKITLLQTAFENLSKRVINGEAFKTLIDLATALLDVLNLLLTPLEWLNGFFGSFGILGAAAVRVLTSLKISFAGIKTTILGFMKIKLGNIIGNAGAAFSLFTESVKQGNGKLKSFKDVVSAATVGVNWWTLAIQAGILAISLISNSIKKHTQELEDAAKTSREELEKTKTELKEFQDLVTEYENLVISGEWDNTPLEDKKKLQEQINALLDDEIEKVDLLKGDYKDVSKELYNQTITKLGDVSTNAQSARNKAYDAFEDAVYWHKTTSDLIGYNITLSDKEATFIENFTGDEKDNKLFSHYTKAVGTGNTVDTIRITPLDYKDLWGSKKRLEELEDFLDALVEADLGNGELFRYVQDFLDLFGTKDDDYLNTIKEDDKAKAEVKVQDYITETFGGYIKSKEEFDKLIEWINKEGFFSGYRKGYAKTYAQENYNLFGEDLPENAFEGGGTSGSKFSFETFTEAEGALSSVNSVMTEFTENGFVTFETLSKVAEAVGLGEDQWEGFYNQIVGVENGANSLNSVMSNLIDTVLRAKFIDGNGVFTGTEEEIARLLRGMGVSNYEEMAGWYADFYAANSDSNDPENNGDLKRNFAKSLGIDIEKKYDENGNVVTVKNKFGVEVGDWVYIYNGKEYDGLEEATRAAMEDQGFELHFATDIEKLSTTSQSLNIVKTAFDEIRESGDLTTDTIAKLQEATGLSESEFEGLKQTLMSSTEAGDEFKNAMKEIAFAILDASAKENNFDWTTVTEEELAQILSENGILEDIALAREYLKEKIAAQKIEELNLIEVTKDGASVNEDAEVALKGVAEECGLTGEAFARLVISEAIFNNTDLDTSQKLQALDGLITKLATAEFITDQVAEKLRGISGGSGGITATHDVMDIDGVSEWFPTATAEWAKKNGFNVEVARNASGKPITKQVGIHEVFELVFIDENGNKYYSEEEAFYAAMENAIGNGTTGTTLDITPPKDDPGDKDKVEIKVPVQIIADIKTDLSGIQDIVNEFAEKGKVSFDSISSFYEVFKDTEGINRYMETLQSADLTSEDFAQTLSDATYELIVQKAKAGKLTKEHEGLLVSMLESMGVANAAEVAHAALARAMFEQQLAGINLAQADSAVIESLRAQALECGMTEAAFYELIATEIMFGNNGLDVSQKIEALTRLASAALGANEAIAAIGGGITQNSSGGYDYNGKSYDTEAAAKEAQVEHIYDNFMEAIDNSTPAITYTPTPSTSDGGSGGGGGGGENDAFKKELDERKDLLERYKADIEAIDFGLETISEDSVVGKASLMSEKMAALTTYGKALSAEFNRVSNIMPGTEEDVESLSSKLSELAGEIRENITEMRALQLEAQMFGINVMTDAIEDHISDVELQISSLETRLKILTENNPNAYAGTKEFLANTAGVPLRSDFSVGRKTREEENLKLIAQEKETQKKISKIVLDGADEREYKLAKSNERIVLDVKKTGEDTVEVANEVEAEVSDVMEGIEDEAKTTSSTIENIIATTDIKLPAADTTAFTESIEEVIADINEKYGDLEVNLDVKTTVHENVVNDGSAPAFGVGTGGDGEAPSNSNGFVLPDGTYRQTSEFHEWRPDENTYHDAVDFGAAEGTPVYFPFNGTVTGVNTGKPHPSMGYYIIIKDDKGNTHRFLHFSKASNLPVNSRVASGQKIGEVGSTGHSTGNHLHWDVTDPEGNRIDPLSLLAIGTNGHPGGRAIVGEKGVETAIFPDGTAGLVGTDGATIMDLPKGTQIIPNGETKKMFKRGIKPLPAYDNGTVGWAESTAAGLIAEGWQVVYEGKHKYPAIGNDIIEEVIYELKKDGVTKLIQGNDYPEGTARRFGHTRELNIVYVESGEPFNFDETYRRMGDYILEAPAEVTFKGDKYFEVILPDNEVRLYGEVPVTTVFPTGTKFSRDKTSTIDGLFKFGSLKNWTYVEDESEGGYWTNSIPSNHAPYMSENGRDKIIPQQYGENGELYFVDPLTYQSDIQAWRTKFPEKLTENPYEHLDDMVLRKAYQDMVYAINNINYSVLGFDAENIDRVTVRTGTFTDAEGNVRFKPIFEYCGKEYDNEKDLLDAISYNLTGDSYGGIAYADQLSTTVDLLIDKDYDYLISTMYERGIMPLKQDQHYDLTGSGFDYIDSSTSEEVTGTLEESMKHVNVEVQRIWDFVNEYLYGDGGSSIVDWNGAKLGEILADLEYDMDLNPDDYKDKFWFAEESYKKGFELLNASNDKLNSAAELLADEFHDYLLATELDPSDPMYREYDQEVVDAYIEAIGKIGDAIMSNDEQIMSLFDAVIGVRDDAINDIQALIDYTDSELDNAVAKGDVNTAIRKIGQILPQYDEIKKQIEGKIAFYRAAGYAEDSPEILALKESLLDVDKSMDSIGDKAGNALTSAFEEYKRYFSKVTEELQEQADAYDIYIEKANARAEAEKRLYNSLRKIREIQRDITKELATNKNLSEYLDAATRKLLFNEDDYDVLSKKLKGISADVKEINQWYERQIHNLNEDNWYLEEAITAEYERRLAAKEKEYEIARAELDLAKKEQELNNVLNEKNIRMLTKNEDGKYEWKYVHNVQEAAKVAGEIADIQGEIDEIKLQGREDENVAREQKQAEYLNSEKAALEKRIELINEELDAMADIIENIKNPVREFQFIAEALNGGAKSLLRFEKERADAKVEDLNYEYTHAIATLNFHLENNGNVLDDRALELQAEVNRLYKELTEAEAMAKALDNTTSSLEDFGLSLDGFGSSLGSLSSYINTRVIKGSTSTGVVYKRNGSRKGSGGKRSYATTADELLANKGEDLAKAEAVLNSYLDSNGDIMDSTAKKLAEDAKDARTEYERAVNSFTEDELNNPTNGARPVFDQGGSALGKGIMFKDTEYEEYVLNPDQTDYFKKFVENTKGLDIVAQQMAGFIKTPNFPFKENIKSDSYSFSGDIILPGVRNPEDFMVALKNHLQQNSFRNT